MAAFDTPKTKAMRAFIEKEGPNGTGRVVGLSIESDGVFIYTNSAEWCDDSGAGTFREDSETAAIRTFNERVQKADPAFVAAEREWASSPRNPLNAPHCERCGAVVRHDSPRVAEARDNGPTRYWHGDCAPLALGGPDKREGRELMDAAAIASALRRARPITAFGSFAPARRDAVRGQYDGWRYAVVKLADALQAAHGAGFDRNAFNVAAGADQ